MTGSRVSKFLCAVALGALVVPAMAQWVDPKPPVLAPGDYPPEATDDPPDAPKAGPAPQQASGQASNPGDATGAPQTLTPTDSDQQPAGQAYVPPKAQPGPVEVGALGSPEGPPVGTLDSTNGGFGDHLWSGSDRGKVEALLAKAPIVSGDPVLRDLVRRAVLTRAPAPPGTAPKAFVTVRIERLLAAGLLPEAGALAAQASVPNDDGFARVQAEAVLLANRAGDACGPATAARQTGGDVFWMQLRAYCAAATGDTATAELTRQVLKVQGHNDPAYDALVDAVLTKKPLPPGAIPNPTALHVFLLQQAGLPVTEPVARKMGTAENLLAMRDSRNSPRARFEAAERVVATGAATPAELVKIADAQDLPLGKVAGAAGEAPNLPFFMGQVLLRRAAMIEPRPEAKAELVMLALSLGEKFKLSPIAAALQADVITSIKPATAPRDCWRPFALTLLLAGKRDAAARWTQDDPVLKAVVAIATNDPARIGATQKDFSAWASSINHPDPAAPDLDRGWHVLILGVADALHTPMPPDAAAVATTLASQMRDGQISFDGNFESVVGAPERRGEAVLMIANTAHSIGFEKMAPDITISLIRALNDIGEPAAARAFAVEAMARYVPPPAQPGPQALAQ